MLEASNMNTQSTYNLKWKKYIEPYVYRTQLYGQCEFFEWMFFVM